MKQSRGDMMKGRHPMPPIPPEVDYLWQVFCDTGPTHHTATGERALRVGDLTAYASAIPSLVEPWEYRAVAQMSAAYVRGKISGQDPFRIAPMDR